MGKKDAVMSTKEELINEIEETPILNRGRTKKTNGICINYVESGRHLKP
jgi:hypothetical protein